jgi:hypothetical protein
MHTNLLRYFFLSLAFLSAASAFAGSEFDGSYDAKLICGKNAKGDAGFTSSNKIVVTNDTIKDVTEKSKPTQMVLSGSIKNGQFTALGTWQNQNGQEKYEVKLS